MSTWKWVASSELAWLLRKSRRADRHDSKWPDLEKKLLPSSFLKYLLKKAKIEKKSSRCVDGDKVSGAWWPGLSRVRLFARLFLVRHVWTLWLSDSFGFIWKSSKPLYSCLSNRVKKLCILIDTLKRLIIKSRNFDWGRSSTSSKALHGQEMELVWRNSELICELKNHYPHHPWWDLE
jgi:hypothetical protein